MTDAAHRAALAVLARGHAGLDAIINNAGALFGARHLTEDGLERTFALNHLAYFALTDGLRQRLIASAPVGFQIHVMLAWVLFAAWPFTRLVHVFSAPVGYLTRPYIVYRSRGGPPLGRPARRGWEPVRRPGSSS